MKLAIVSTPRSGSTWLRHLLARVYAAREIAVHDLDDVDWAHLAADCILQVHVHPADGLDALVGQGFRPIVIRRHPLDVLVSILRYAMYEGATRRWLNGDGGTEASIVGAMPGSTAFLQYAIGRRAAALLSVSRAWWDRPATQRVSYETLVADPIGELTRVTDGLGLPLRQSVAVAVAANGFGNLRARSGTPGVPEYDHHYWRGTPGHWKGLLTAEVAETIAAAHRDVFSTLGYLCDPDLTLDAGHADANWIAGNRQELTDRLWNFAPMKQQLQRALEENASLQSQLDEFRTATEAQAAPVAHHERRGVIGTM